MKMVRYFSVGLEEEINFRGYTNSKEERVRELGGSSVA